jgi:glycosyltransferase involved in cell wall biosynthesis
MTDALAEPDPNPVRLLHVIWSGRIGGAERALYQLVREQSSDPDLEVGVLFARDEGEYVDSFKSLDCEVITLDLPHGHAVSALPQATRAMSPFQMHHFHSAEPLLMVASLRCRGARRFYTHRGGVFAYSRKQRIRYRVTGRLVRRFDGLSANTSHAADYASGLLGIDRARFEVTYNGLDFELLQPKREAASVRTGLGLGADEFVVGTAAHLRGWKRIDQLIAAVGSMNEDGIRLLVVGDGEDRPRLESCAADSGLDQRALFIGEQSDIVDYLQVMDAFCLPSNAAESFGNAAVEAMAMGLPTIVFADGGGLLEHVEPEHTGFVVADRYELERLLGRLMADPELGRAVGAEARSTVHERYSLRRAGAAYRELYGLGGSSTPVRMEQRAMR